MSPPTALSQSELAARLKSIREQANFASATEAARNFGWNENTYRSHENGERGLKTNILVKYAQAFNVSLRYLMFGDEFGGKIVNMIGVIGDGGHVDKNWAKSEEIFIDFDSKDQYIGFLLRSRSLHPRYDIEDLMLFSSEPAQSPEQYPRLNSEGICVDDSGGHRFGRLFNSPNGLFYENIGSPPQPFAAILFYRLAIIFKRGGGGYILSSLTDG